MSRRISNKAEMTDRSLVAAALGQADMKFQDEGDIILITSGPIRSARIYLKTGEVVGDSDYGHTAEGFGVLRQHYAEAKVRAEYAKTGTSIDAREQTQEGDIVLMWHVG